MRGVPFDETFYEPPLCSICKHLHRDEEACDAFPDGIPHDIRIGRQQHEQPVDGDHGIVFERTDEQP